MVEALSLSGVSSLVGHGRTRCIRARRTPVSESNYWPIHRIALRNCLINSWRASRLWCTAGARGQNGACLPPYTRSRDPKIGPTSIYQTVSEEKFSETELSLERVLGNCYIVSNPGDDIRVKTYPHVSIYGPPGSPISLVPSTGYPFLCTCLESLRLSSRGLAH